MFTRQETCNALFALGEFFLNFFLNKKNTQIHQTKRVILSVSTRNVN